MQTRLPFLLVGIWALAMVGAFWHFFHRDLGQFGSGDLSFFDGEQVSHSLGEQFRPSAAVGQVVHFWDRDCRCSRFNRQHARDVMQQFGEQGISFVVAVPSAAAQADARRLFPEASDVIVVRDAATVSSPAAAAFNAGGELLYYGPYSDGVLCTSTEGSPVEQVLSDLLADRQPRQWLNLSAVGCYCQWPAQTRT